MNRFTCARGFPAAICFALKMAAFVFLGGAAEADVEAFDV